MSNHSSGGGAATASGMDFQHRVAAWLAVRILAEKGSTPLWDLASPTSLEALRCESGLSVDDILASTSEGGFVLLNAKRSLSLSRRSKSELMSAFGQFVRQFLASQRRSDQLPGFNRPMDASRDRLVLVTGSTSSANIRAHLRQVLERLRRPGPAVDLATIHSNDEEREALSVVVSLIRHAWQTATGSSPSDQEIIDILRLIYVQELNVEAGGIAEREARDTLRNVILEDADQAEGAWGRLISECSRLAATRSGTDRAALQQILTASNFPLKATFSYRPDVERLRKYSRQTLSNLKAFSEIQIGAQTVKVAREYQVEFFSAANNRSLLVVGEPGAGKSGALHDLVQALDENGIDFIFLAVDRLSAESIGELRQELGLQNEIYDLLDNWPGHTPVVFAIDALDAARAEPKMRLYRELIRNILARNSNWRVIASIRKFDLRNSKELQQIFRGRPVPGFLDPEFPNDQHINIRQLTDSEVAQIGTQSEELFQLVQKASPELQGLIRIVFNLRLLAELLDMGAAPSELTPIRTQIELLDKYWAYRVIGEDHLGYAREQFLSEICRTMVQNRSLRIYIPPMANPVNTEALTELLRNHVLIQWQPSPTVVADRYTLVFAHNILFDYAVSRLLLRLDPESFVQYLADETDLFLIIRPSISFHFQHLWISEPIGHRSFWQLGLLLSADPRIPEIGKLIAPSVVTDLAAELSDFAQLMEALDGDDPVLRRSAEGTLAHIIGSLLTRSDKSMLAGPKAGPWSEFMERLGQGLRVSTVYPVASLLATGCKHFTDFTEEQRDNYGSAARQLLQFLWDQPSSNQWLRIQGIEAVCRTFDSDCAASAALLRRAIEREHLARYGHQELSCLGNEIKNIIQCDPQLVAEIYKKTFEFEESSDEKTAMGASQILSMTSTRQQDYGMGLWHLAEAFPEFLAKASDYAIDALIAVLEAYVKKEHSSDFPVEPFDFHGQAARFQADYSSVWDRGDIDKHKEPIKMLDAFFTYLRELASRADTEEAIADILAILVVKNKLAVIWRRLLPLGSEFPETFGKRVAPLGWAMPILKAYDTTHEVGVYLTKVFPQLDNPARARIEEAILSIPQSGPPERQASAEHVRNRLLGCLPMDNLVTAEARTLLAQLQAAQEVPENVLRPAIEAVWRPHGEEEYLREEGVPVDEAPNRRIRDFEVPVKEFVEKYRNTVPAPEDVASVMPALQELHQALKNAETDGVHPLQSEHGWGELGAAAVLIARMENIDCEDEAGKLIRDMLLELHANPNPIHSPEYDQQFDEHPSWGSPVPRVEAARGLILLARKERCADGRVLDAVERLSRDAVPAVRFQIGAELRFLNETAPDLMWQIVERMSETDPSRGVLQFLLHHTLVPLSNLDIDRVVNLTFMIYNRITEGPGSKKVRDECMDIFTGLYLSKNHPACAALIQAVADQPGAHFDEAQKILLYFREASTFGLENPDAAGERAVRQRIYELTNRILDGLLRDYAEMESVLSEKPSHDWSDEQKERAKNTMQLIDLVAREIYFASNAHKAREASYTLTPPEKERAATYYHECGALLDKLVTVVHPAITHHLLESLEYFIPLDPKGVLRRIGQALDSGKRGGYQFASLGAKLFVKIVQRYLAEHGDLLQRDLECRQVILNALNIFVSWPQARQLTYKLEDIFR